MPIQAPPEQQPGQNSGGVITAPPQAPQLPDLPTQPTPQPPAPTSGGNSSGGFPNSGGNSNAPASNVNATADEPKEGKLIVTGTGGLIPIVYGRAQIEGKVIALGSGNATRAYMSILWCLGEVDAIEAISVHNAETTDTGSVINQVIDSQSYQMALHTDYVGSAAQGIDPTLAANIAGYADTNVINVRGGSTAGVAYSVFTLLQPDKWAGVPRFVATVRGCKVYDPRTATTVYSNNPALALADFINNPARGLGEAIDWNSVETLADICDTLLSGSKRRTINLALTTEASADQWLDTLRTYAGCMITRRGGEFVLIPDRPATVSIAFTADDIVDKSLKLSKNSRNNTPTAVIVKWTATDVDPWTARDTPPVLAAGVAAGTTPYRLSRLDMKGITSYAEAYRMALERLNAHTLRDLLISFTVHDEGLAVEVGDVVSVTHPIGLAAKQFRVLDVGAAGPGRWTIHGEEYDAAVYSDSVQSEPTTPDLNLPDPGAVPVVQNITLNEEVYKLVGGGYSSRVIVRWDEIEDFPYLAAYGVFQIGPGGASVVTVPAGNTMYKIEPVEGGKNYTVLVFGISSSGAKGGAIFQTITAQGKLLIPGDVPAIRAWNVEGEVFLEWEAAVDIDIVAYEIRVGGFGNPWSSLQKRATVDALETSLKGFTVGTYTFAVKAIDSVGQYSENEARITIDVTDHAEQDKSYTHTPQTVFFTQGMHSYTLPGVSGTFYVSLGTSAPVWNSAFPGATVFDDYTEVLFYYCADNTSEKYIELTGDTGPNIEIAGKWQVYGSERDFMRIRGRVDTEAGLHSGYINRSYGGDDLDYTWGAPNSDTFGTVIRVYGAYGGSPYDNDCFVVRVPGISYRVDQKLKIDTGSGTTSGEANPSLFELIISNVPFADVKSITVTPTDPDVNVIVTQYGGWSISFGNGTTIPYTIQPHAAFSVVAIRAATTADSSGSNYVEADFTWQITGY